MMTVTITATHENGSIMTHTVDQGANTAKVAWTVEIMRQCGYVKIEISNN